MSNDARKEKNEAKYSFISYETRLQIIHHIYNEHLTIKKTAEILGLKASTTRMILKRYREDGVVFERRTERHERVGKGRSLLTNCEESLKSEVNKLVCQPPEEYQNTFVPFIIMPFGCWPPQNAFM